MRRVPEVMDCWFDSGAMPFAQLHYPFENKEKIDAGEKYPADFVCEAIDQTRGWFYTLLAVATLLGREAPYKNVICLGHILDKKGQKMSKHIGNVVDPWLMIEKYGADVIRWYLYSVNQPGEPKRFDESFLKKGLDLSPLKIPVSRRSDRSPALRLISSISSLCSKTSAFNSKDFISKHRSEPVLRQ